MTENEMTKIFLNRLSYLMDQNKINQVELSNILGLDRSTVNKWFTRYTMPRAGIIEKICEYFGVEKSFLFSEKPPLGKRVYYFDEATAEDAQYIHDNPDLKVVFNSLRKMKPESIKTIKDFIEFTKAKERHDDDYLEVYNEDGATKK
jgi:transcriptional regulator with XRE-family HTH domain